MGKTHALVIPFPAQGHINPLMKLSHRLVEHGFTITFVNTDFNHSRVVAALKESGEEFRGIRLVSIPDGMAPGEDRNQMGKVYDAVEHTGASYVEALICEINANGGDHITCVIADATYWPALKVAGKLGIRGAAFCPASAGSLATAFSIPKLVEDGILDVNGMQSQVTALLNLANVKRKQVQHPTRYEPLNHSRSKAYNDLRMSKKKKSARLSKSPKNLCWSFIYCLCPTILDGAGGMQLGASAVPRAQQMRLWPCGTGSFACTCGGVIGGPCAPSVCAMGLCHIGTGESVVPSAQQRPRARGMKDIMFE